MADMVNRPPHYADGWSNGAEVIDIAENLNFNRGNCVKYVARAGKKDPAKEIEDLEKAEFYLKREIKRLKAADPELKLASAKDARAKPAGGGVIYGSIMADRGDLERAQTEAEIQRIQYGALYPSRA